MLIISLLSVSIVFNIILLYLLKIYLTKTKIYVGWILEIKDLSQQIYDMMKKIDDRQIFEKDDEVGDVFSRLKSLIDYFKEKVVDEN